MEHSDEYKLFHYALKQLKEAGLHKEDWVMGGGTVLKHYYEHRFSRDIDIFFDDPQKVNALSPRFNDANEKDLEDYFEDSVCLKMVFPEGKVDFVRAGNVTDYGASLVEFHG
jgi:hypothetical protein